MWVRLRSGAGCGCWFQVGNGLTALSLSPRPSIESVGRRFETHLLSIVLLVRRSSLDERSIIVCLNVNVGMGICRPDGGRYPDGYGYRDANIHPLVAEEGIAPERCAGLTPGEEEDWWVCGWISKRVLVHALS